MEEIIFASGSVPGSCRSTSLWERRILDSSRHRIRVATNRKSYSKWKARYKPGGNEL